MDEPGRVEVGNGQGHIVADADLPAVWKRLRGFLQQCSQTFLHQFHQENREPGVGVTQCAQKLDNVGVSKVADDGALFLKLLSNIGPPRDVEHEQTSVDELGSTGKLVPVSQVDSTVGASPNQGSPVDGYLSC